MLFIFSVDFCQSFFKVMNLAINQDCSHNFDVTYSLQNVSFAVGLQIKRDKKA